MRKAIAQPGVKSVAIAWPLPVLAHFALFTYIAPFIREAGLPDYAISLSLTVLGASGLIGIWIAGIAVDSRRRRSLLIMTAAIAVAMLLLPLGGGTIPGAMILMTVWGVGLGAVGILDPVQDGLLVASVIPNRRYSSSRARHEVVRTRPCTRQSGCLQILFRR
jgi:predicted MFS family arabinose efflux permease